VVRVPPCESTGGTRVARGDLWAKCRVLRSDEAICLSCRAILARGGTSNDDTASAINAVEEVGGASGTPWSVAPPPKKSAMSHVGNGAVNGSRMSTTSQMAESWESTVSADSDTKLVPDANLMKTRRNEPWPSRSTRSKRHLCC
jgi:hypothetical protein